MRRWHTTFLLIQMPTSSCRYRGFILLLTFLIYTCFHMSRKPISVVKVRLAWGGEERGRRWALVEIHCSRMVWNSAPGHPSSVIAEPPLHWLHPPFQWLCFS